MAKHSAQLKTQDSGLPAIKDGLTKKQVAQLAEQSVHHVLEAGNVFQMAEALGAMDEFVKCVRKDERYVQFLRDELAKHHGRLITTSGARIENCEAGVSYDYSGSAEWRDIDAQIKFLSEQKKALEEKLRKITPGKMVVDTETGEVFEGPLKTSKSTYRITLAR
jgi:hypothetical protein